MRLPILAALWIIEAAEVYQKDDSVQVFVNKVGPYFNPHETYHYYSLPVCRPKEIKHRPLTLGEVLDGDRMAYSLYNIRYLRPEKQQSLCTVTLTADDIEKLKESIRELYYFEFSIDDLPVRGFVGHFEESGLIPVPHVERCYLWASLHFTFTYNEDRIISANVSTAGSHPISLDDNLAPLEVEFSYSVDWIESTVPFTNREHLKGKFFPKTLEIHWLSVINSVVLVVLLTGFILIILMRVLKNDFNRYNKEEVMDDEMAIEDECGWKVIHTEVFRFPTNIGLLSSVLGVGSQFLAMAGGILLMALCGVFRPGHGGAIHTYSIILYCVTSSIAGYVSGSFYRKFGGQNWVRNVLLTASLFTVPFFLIWFIINCTHWYAGSTQALPFTTILLLMLVYVLVGFPLTVIGGIVARNTTADFDSPCRTRPVPRAIPPQPWYTMIACHCFFGGFLPFSAISVELYYIFATVWGREQYTLYGVLLLVFIIVLSVSACISIALTYFQLSSEDYRWWWRSIFSAGSTGTFVFIYSCFYYLKRSNMSGAVETIEFLGYTALMCYIFFLTLGAIGFAASLKECDFNASFLDCQFCASFLLVSRYRQLAVLFIRMLRSGLRIARRNITTGVTPESVIVLDSCRTPFTKSSTAYSELMPHDMLRGAVSATVKRSGIDVNEIDYAVAGTVIAEVKTSNVMREATLGAGLPQSLPSHTVTMACISSNVAITTGMGFISSGAGDVVLCGGVETMSDVPIRHAKAMRKHLLRNQKLLTKGPSGIAKFLKPVFAAPGKYLAPEPPAIAEFSTGEIMGHSADRLAAAWGVSRNEQDLFAVRSHTNAKAAQEKGLLSDVFEYHIPGGDTISLDNGIQVNTMERMGQLKAAFVKPHGTITAANSSFLTDGASAAIIAKQSKADELGLKGKSILRDYMYVALDPKDQLLLGPAYGIARLLKRAGLTVDDIDVWEIHEAFAGQVLANLEALKDDKFCREYMNVGGAVGEVPMDKLNNWGGSLSMGHPFGATGIRLVSHSTNRLKHEDGQFAFIAACAAGGHAFAGIVERHPDN